MHKTAAGPSLASDLHALAGLYATLFREMRRQAKHGHAWPPHRHTVAPSSPAPHAARTSNGRQ